ncbi:uncharacterized protein LOC129607452 [Condylostylus longicornis]|uniref:uncharacterized protein LOC129607434 n=1 Tax=Condylostylus longicornis TaxID=2530218 RepID=UPI00244DD045|nr:uncharacterized protein LOC129607434 [Condylostylus longicornis]XP_055374460.1 uncharacterized protein LOC129607452 [Condylostylus longicornis]
MGKQTSLETRQIIIDLHKKGKSLRNIANTTNRSHNTVKYVIDKYKNFNEIDNFKKSGRPKRLSDKEIRQIVREVKNNPSVSAVKISKNITQTSEKPVSASTIRRALRENGLHGRSPRRKPYISKINQQKRLEFAKKYENKDVNFW